MPQSVGAKFGCACQAGILCQKPIDAAFGRERPPLPHPQGVIGAHVMMGLQVLPQSPPGRSRDGNAPVCGPLPTPHGDEARALAQGYIPPREIQKLRRPEARAHQELHQGDVPHVPAPMDGPQEAAQLLGREGPGPEALPSQPPYPLGGIGADITLGEGPFEEAGQGGEFPVHRGGGGALHCEEVGLVVGDVPGDDRGGVEGLSARFLFSLSREIFRPDIYKGNAYRGLRDYPVVFGPLEKLEVPYLSVAFVQSWKL